MQDHDDLKSQIEQLRADLEDSERRAIAVAAAMVKGVYESGRKHGRQEAQQLQEDEPNPDGARGHLRWFRGGLAALAGLALLRHFRRDVVAVAVTVAAFTTGVIGMTMGGGPGIVEPSPPPIVKPTSLMPSHLDPSDEPTPDATTPAADTSSTSVPPSTSPSPSGDAMLPPTAEPPSPTQPPDSAGDEDGGRQTGEPSPSPDPSPSTDGDDPVPPTDDDDHADQVGPNPLECVLDLDIPVADSEVRLVCPSPTI